QLYGRDDPRRDRGFTLFYMGINAGALVAPLLTGWMAAHFTDTPLEQNYRLLSGIGATGLQWVLGLLFVVVAAMLLVEAARHGRVQTHRVIAMLIIFA